MRRAQVSVFIVAGLIVLLVVALFMYLTELDWRRMYPHIDDRFIVTGTVAPVRLYVETCLSEVSVPLVRQMAQGGGTRTQVNSRRYNRASFNYLCNSEGAHCVPTLLLRQDMERELELAILENLSRCIDLSIFEQQGFSIEAGTMDLNVTVGREDLTVRLHYPLRLKSKTVELTIDEYRVQVDKPLGLLYDLAVEIVNAENKEGYFDHVDYMYRNGNTITIQKERPYPDLLYTLQKDDLQFRFALQGRVAEFGASASASVPYGCCYNLYDKDCYQDVPAYACAQRGGIHDANPGCACPRTQDTNIVTCNGHPCRDCGNTYDYTKGLYTRPTRSHGESWCSYEAIAGKGYDYVGSRHYLHSCIDGVEYIEGCRDFREELCTSEQIVRGGTSMSKAVCRPNRWQDCTACATEQCCKDLRYRDCDWKAWLTTDKKCVPQVPPGLRFWEYQGGEVCSRATQTKECQGFSCPNIWVDDTAVYCYMQADCGNYRNVMDRISYGGFFNSDFHDTVREYVYLSDGLIFYGDNYTIQLGIANRAAQRLAEPSVFEAQDNFLRVISAGMNYLDRMNSFSVSDFLNPASKFRILDIAVCDVWQPPRGGADCWTCSKFPQQPCSEYKCRSLGAQCMYEEKDGVPSCYSLDPNDKTPPFINLERLQQGYRAEPTVLRVKDVTYHGYRVKPDIRPFRLFGIAINTSKETTCRITYTPQLKYLSVPSYYFGKGQYALEHNLTLRVPGRIALPKKFLDIFNLTSMTEFLMLLEEPQRFMNTYEERYRVQIALYESMTGKDFDGVVQPFVQKVLAFLADLTTLVPFYRELFYTLLDNFERGHYYLFIQCQDRAGNKNVEELYIEFSINETDREPPVVLGFEPDNNSLVASGTEQTVVRMFLDEPAECRFDRTDRAMQSMSGSFACPDSLYAMYPRYGGSYLCTAEINATETPIYIRCEDNPRRILTYPLTIEHGSVPGVRGAEPSKYLNVTPPNRIYASSGYLAEGTAFVVSETSIEFNFYIDDPLNCTYSYAGERFGFRRCDRVTDLELGLYRCLAEIQLIENASAALSLSLNITLIDDVAALPMDGVLMGENSAAVNISRTGSQVAIYTNRTLWVNLSFDSLFACDGLMCESADAASVCSADFGTSMSTLVNCTEKPKAIGGSLHYLTVQCEQPPKGVRNANLQATQFTLRLSEPLEIVSHGPKDETDTTLPLLFVETTKSRDVVCGYYQELALGTLAMAKVNATRHQVQVPVQKGRNSFTVVCRDAYSNVAQKQIDFLVI